jgi:hypothetical protein
MSSCPFKPWYIEAYNFLSTACYRETVPEPRPGANELMMVLYPISVTLNYSTLIPAHKDPTATIALGLIPRSALTDGMGGHSYSRDEKG